MKKIVLGISGASGSIYAKRLMEKLSSVNDLDVGVVMSPNAILNWEIEIGKFDPDFFPFTFYDKDDFDAPFASGSAGYKYMIVAPCSMGTLSKIACGHSNDLMTRAADVILKEKRKLILVCRETPLSLIHIDNMRQVTLAGGMIMPASPSFYSQPQNIEDMVDTVVDRVIDQCDINQETYRWGE